MYLMDNHHFNLEVESTLMPLLPLPLSEELTLMPLPLLPLAIIPTLVSVSEDQCIQGEGPIPLLLLHIILINSSSSLATLLPTALLDLKAVITLCFLNQHSKIIVMLSMVSTFRQEVHFTLVLVLKVCREPRPLLNCTLSNNAIV